MSRINLTQLNININQILKISIFTQDNISIASNGNTTINTVISYFGYNCIGLSSLTINNATTNGGYCSSCFIYSMFPQQNTDILYVRVRNTASGTANIQVIAYCLMLK